MADGSEKRDVEIQGNLETAFLTVESYEVCSGGGRIHVQAVNDVEMWRIYDGEAAGIYDAECTSVGR